MQYNSWLYVLLFLGGAVLAYYLTPLRRRWVVLLAASTVFYLISSRQLIVVLAATAAVVYWGARRIDGRKRAYQEKKAALEKEERRQLKADTDRRNSRTLAAVCVVAFGVLFFTKYFNFVGSNLNLLFRTMGLSAAVPALRLMMPLGISFYTLSAVSYLVDVSQGTCRAQENYWKLLAFLMFFPVITEGPISRYGQLGEQVAQGHSFDYRQFCFGAQLIVWGLFQKVVLADRLDRCVGNLFDHYQSYSGGIIALAILLYTFQIYMDFAGCVDIARGSAELFGIHLAQNFTQPFFAVSVNDFWRRWHITLGAWLRDYIFYPISLSRSFQTLSKNSRKHLNAYYAATLPALAALLAVWFGNGVWHGAEWKYIVYGLYYYAITALGMLLEPAFVRLLALLHLSREQAGYRVFQMLRTFVFVNLGMMIFRAANLHAAWGMFLALFQNGGNGGETVAQILTKEGLPAGQAAIVAAGAVLVMIADVLKERGVPLRERIADRPLPVRWSIYLAAVVLVIVAGAYGPGFGTVDFIYAQF